MAKNTPNVQLVGAQTDMYSGISGGKLRDVVVDSEHFHFGGVSQVVMLAVSCGLTMFLVLK